MHLSLRKAIIPSMRYPEQLVNEYGAKAGVLMYVANQLPEIPQAPMLVTRKGESAEEFIKRSGMPTFRLPWLVRSSAVAELDGYEGEFPTKSVNSPSSLEAVMQIVQDSPRTLKKEGIGLELPDQINAIVAEKAPSRYFGTLIKHPNIPDYYLMSLTQTEKNMIFGYLRFSYSYRAGERLKFLENFTGMHSSQAPLLGSEALEVISWHDKIASLPEMDPDWSYQIEFGLYPNRLFQARPFRPYEFADFTIPGESEDRFRPIAIGITPPEGITTRIRKLSFNYAYEMFDNMPEEGEPIVAVDDLRYASLARRLPNHQANLFGAAFGFLAHNDIAAMRSAKVTGLYASSPMIHGGRRQGDWVRIISDGNSIEVRNLKLE